MGEAIDQATRLADIERYLDAAPRLVARTEDHGPLTLFVGEPLGTPFYARPGHDHRGPVTRADVESVRARQRQLGVPEAFEWVAELAPTMLRACRAAGLATIDHPLLVLGQLVEPEPAPEVTVDLLTADSADEDLAAALSVPPVAFARPTTGVEASAGDWLSPAVAPKVAPAAIRGLRRRFDEDTMRSAVARIDGRVVAVASAIPFDGIAEVVGVATLPASRRRGCAAAATARVAAAVRDLGVDTTFLSAGDQAATRLYERLGFRRIATSAVAEPA